MWAKRQERMLLEHGHTARKTHSNPVILAMKAFDVFTCGSDFFFPCRLPHQRFRPTMAKDDGCCNLCATCLLCFYSCRWRRSGKGLATSKGSSLRDAHIMGLAVFAIHLNEAKASIPAIDLCSSLDPSCASTRGLSVSELWDYFLDCQAGQSATFCMKFCVVALSYFLCKFGSLPHDSLCSVLHPGFVKKLQYVVPLLCSEARNTSWEGSMDDDLPWKTLSRPSFCYSKAALCLWKHPLFKELLWEKAFQLTLQEWLLMELAVCPDEDVLSAVERQDFHYWALYQHFLPLSVAAGGCEGDLREACAVLLDAVLDFGQRGSVIHTSRSELGKCNHPNNPKRSTFQRRGNPDIYARLQEMLLELELERRRAWPVSGGGKEELLLFRVFQKRLKGLKSGEEMHRQQELFLQTRQDTALSNLYI
ncbi:Fanconi anemia group A protein-like isoform X1 [Anolis carolinensis]|uniref:Fanconi anemia group A protein-like isoform X1 n=1 Tax=Anolis carolinensis TaxID=28377 RepID=UPI002F2B47CB